VTYLISANKVEELEQKGLFSTFDNTSTLDVVGLNDGNNESIEFQMQDSQIDLNNITKVCYNYK
jgi:hypothetical protein